MANMKYMDKDELLRREQNNMLDSVKYFLKRWVLMLSYP